MLTLEEVISRFHLKHGNKYDYSKVVFKRVTEDVIIICPIHGEFIQYPQNHFICGCQKCGTELRAAKKTGTTEKFIKKAKEIHGDKYDYSKTVFIKGKLQVIITCPIHGDFEQQANNHISGKGCILCGHDQAKALNMSNTEKFIKKARDVHGNKYDYSESVYTGNKNKITIICPTHGRFEQRPSNHTFGKGKGCRKCRYSKGEEIIANYLLSKGIPFETHKSIQGCKHINHLTFDFSILDKNGQLQMLLEYDGKQHFVAFNFSRREPLELVQARDEVKNKFCKENNIVLKRINYKQNINEELDLIFKEWK